MIHQSGRYATADEWSANLTNEVVTTGRLPQIPMYGGSLFVPDTIHTGIAMERSDIAASCFMSD